MAKSKKRSVEKNDDGPCRVNGPEDWPAALAIESDLKVPEGTKVFKFHCRAVSMKEDVAASFEFPYPEAPRDSRGILDIFDADYLNGKADAEFRRMIRIVDTCWKPIPGDDIEAKVSFAQERLWRDGMFKDLFNMILRLSGYEQGVRMEDEASDAEIEVDSIEDLAVQTQKPILYRFHCPVKPIEFVVHGINNLSLKAIEKATDPGSPPKTMGTKIAGGRSKQEPVPNMKDPQYLERVKAKSDERNLLIMEKALGFRFPGETAAERQAWLFERPAGQVQFLLSFIKASVLTYQDRTDFFSAA